MENYPLEVGDLVLLRSKVKRAVIVAKYKKLWFTRYIVRALDGDRHLCRRSELQYLRTASQLEVDNAKLLEQYPLEATCL